MLVSLLESAGEVVTKEQLIDNVWAGGNVGEESLTRCIYVLRRILQEGKHQRFIDTVYGKGYRFSLPVTKAVPAERPVCASCIFAVLPFKLNSQPQALGLHDAIVQELSGYAAAGLHVLPSSLTHNCSTILATLDMLEKIRPDFYLTGYELPLCDGPCLRMELIRVHDHVVMHRTGIALGDPPDADSINAVLKPLLLRHLSSLGNRQENAQKPQGGSDPQMLLRAGREAFLQYTPASLSLALSLFQQCRQRLPEDREVLCHLAECYFALGQMGMQGLDSALRECGALVETILAQDPRHPLALALGGVLHGLNSQLGQAAEMFRAALTPAADCPSVSYYYAWHLFLVGEIKRARHFAQQAHGMQPAMMAIQVLMMWLAYCDDNASAALQMADGQPDRVQRHPVLLSMKAVILCTEGQPCRAKELIDHLRHGDESDGIVFFNTLYARLFSQPAEADKEQFAQMMKQPEHPMPSALLPVIMQSQGLRAAKKWYDRLSHSSSRCLMLWRHDPRVKQLYSLAGE
ncbi:winged helix-turn-helix domain-containing protein [Sodalis ligni]|uniref:winged helix-turn-helix domain-containing protein n=1 Tax=Sodalis ligni TaxID=2697027 RepID=UPI001BDF2BFC|nr:winged helix-turn-helix domain-containing protein [Sodalis ligni]QWA10516.1 winged helix-turn-helix domain-containing protein [Sodalis ligni]